MKVSSEACRHAASVLFHSSEACCHAASVLFHSSEACRHAASVLFRPQSARSLWCEYSSERNAFRIDYAKRNLTVRFLATFTPAVLCTKKSCPHVRQMIFGKQTAKSGRQWPSDGQKSAACRSLGEPSRRKTPVALLPICCYVNRQSIFVHASIIQKKQIYEQFDLPIPEPGK